ncbi:hypothetical protein C8D77_102498 [Mesorhizobium loti]|uniref:Terminase n=1 Tax=Rhizobium loti TaxID=381 RepID=A0A8E3B6K4_RHILI|nr:hypothetical protein [Mesorhizobium loti]PWJ92723.1 hypothetical protein C8D77_102498 [Mesorhizobium loti]
MDKSTKLKLGYRTQFRLFVDFAFREIHPGPLHANWHIDVMVDALAGIANGGQGRLILNAPPRSLKSFCGSIALPAFLLGRNPTKQILIVVGNPGLGIELLAKLRKLMSSPRYRALFPHVNFDKAASDIALSRGGSIRFAIIGHQISGRGADLIIVDDPLSPSHAKNEKRRSFVNQFYKADIATRLNDKGGAILVIMQRVHSQDLSAHILNHDPSFKRIALSAIALKNETWRLSNGRVWHREKYQPLDPDRESWARLLDVLRQIGSFQFSGQYLQGGGIYFTENETDCKFLWEVPKPDAKPPYGTFGGLVRIRHVDCMVHKVFGVPYTGPRMSTAAPAWTKEYEEYAIAYQAWLSKSPPTDMPEEFRSPERPMPKYVII